MYGPNRSVIECNNGWEYDKSEYESTMSSDFDWVCKNSDVPTNSFTMQALGNAVGTIIFGHLADKYGHR
jgi:OCT family organic cation transporter-like MFS transporter 4/5